MRWLLRCRDFDSGQAARAGIKKTLIKYGVPEEKILYIRIGVVGSFTDPEYITAEKNLVI